MSCVDNHYDSLLKTHLKFKASLLALELNIGLIISARYSTRQIHALGYVCILRYPKNWANKLKVDILFASVKSEQYCFYANAIH